MKYYFSSFLFFTILFSSCICALERMEETTVLVNFKNDNCTDFKIDLHHGSIENIENQLYSITFYAATGGKNYLVGTNILIKDKTANEKNKIKVNCGDEIVSEISYNDLQKIGSKSDGNRMIYTIE